MRETQSRFMLLMSRAQKKDLVLLFQELILILLSAYLKKKFPKFMTVLLRLNQFREKQVQELRLQYSAVTAMLTQEALVSDLAV